MKPKVREEGLIKYYFTACRSTILLKYTLSQFSISVVGLLESLYQRRKG